MKKKIIIMEYSEFFKEHHIKNAFDFTHEMTSERLNYELLNSNHLIEVYNMFKNDESAFVVDYFKKIPELEEYIDGQLNYSRYSTKRSGTD